MCCSGRLNSPPKQDIQPIFWRSIIAHALMSQASIFQRHIPQKHASREKDDMQLMRNPRPVHGFVLHTAQLGSGA
jgi:hypothetical protein